MLILDALELMMKSWVYTRMSLLLSVALILLPKDGSPFLLSSECPAPSPCTCSRSSGSFGYIYMYINCDSKSLTNVPHFELYNTSIGTLFIKLQSNRIETVPNYAFKNLSSIEAKKIYLYLSDNHISSSISLYAFAGINITNLYLDNNNINSVPSAVGKLSNLQELNLQGNPLRSLDASLMSSIAHSLTTLSVDIGNFSEWPAELHYLRKLEFLNIDYFPFPHLDINAFHGFENTLTWLSMRYTKLEKIPHAVCRLAHLNTLSVSVDTNLKENRSPIFEPCGHTLPALTSFTINHNNLHEFPDVSTTFPSLYTLSAQFNRFEYIEQKKIPFGSSIRNVFLNSNNFERIPVALNELKNLVDLSLSNNRIQTIESADLSGLQNLTYLSLDYNPIAYISPDAFKYNPKMSLLSLLGTDLDHVPSAVTHLQHLTRFYISGNPIDCSCDMSYLKNWTSVSSITTFPAKCAVSTETIKTFIMMSLPSCI